MPVATSMGLGVPAWSTRSMISDFVVVVAVVVVSVASLTGDVVVCWPFGVGTCRSASGVVHGSSLGADFFMTAMAAAAAAASRPSVSSTRLFLPFGEATASPDITAAAPWPRDTASSLAAVVAAAQTLMASARRGISSSTILSRAVSTLGASPATADSSLGAATSTPCSKRGRAQTLAFSVAWPTAGTTRSRNWSAIVAAASARDSDCS